MEMKNIIARYARMIAPLNCLEGENPRIFLRIDKKCLATNKDCDDFNMESKGILDVTEKACLEKDVLMTLKEDRAMILCCTPYVGICISSGRRILPVIDDMAQIIGPEVKVVTPSYQNITGALKKSSAVMIRDGNSLNGHALVTGRNLYEAYTALLVLEKAAEVMLKADCIGGAKSIGKLECTFMRRKYRRSYSKLEREHRDVTEK